MAATNIGALLVAAALLAKSGLFGDMLPGAPPTTTPDTFGITPTGLSYAEWQKHNPGGSYLDWQDYLKGV